MSSDPQRPESVDRPTGGEVAPSHSTLPPTASGVPNASSRVAADNGIVARDAASVTRRVPPPTFTPPPFLEPPPGRPNIGSMLFLTAFFFFMSSNNNSAMQNMPMVGPDGELVRRFTELDRIRAQLEGYRGWLNGTSPQPWNDRGQWTFPDALLPARYHHDPSHHSFYQNITGFHRKANTHIVLPSNASESVSPYFDATALLPLREPSPHSVNDLENVTLPLRHMEAGFDWQNICKLDLNVKERHVSTRRGPPNATSADSTLEHEDWSWVSGSVTVSTKSTSKSLDFAGLHYRPNGTYGLYATPNNVYLDVRNLTRLYPNHVDVISRMILLELESEEELLERAMFMQDVSRDNVIHDANDSVFMHLSLPPIPTADVKQSIAVYEEELNTPTGIAWSVPKPPQYWNSEPGLAGVMVVESQNIVVGIEGGRGTGLSDFWRKSINYAVFATVSQLSILLLLVRQMELTRTPSTLANVSLWTIVMMGFADSWIFSAHVVLGITSEIVTSLALLAPAFVSFCTAIVFAPVSIVQIYPSQLQYFWEILSAQRYAVLLYRIQAPERNAVQTPAPMPTVAPPGVGPGAASGGSASETSSASRWSAHLQDLPRRQIIFALLSSTAILLILFLPDTLPILMLLLYSFWIPQIWRSASRGTSVTFDRRFILGTSAARLSLALYLFGCPDNVFFIDVSPWIWLLVLWQWLQIMVLFAQDRFGPSFLSFRPAETYNYHPYIPSPTEDPESLAAHSSPDKLLTTRAKDEKAHVPSKICSICMDYVDTRVHSVGGPAGAAGDVILGLSGLRVGELGQRKEYALAPCGHLFHTKCLAQWLAVKTICPLCKRSLPPL